MANTRNMTRNQNHDDNGYLAPWSNLNYDVLFFIMMQLGVIDFIAFSGVCKPWRSLARSNNKKFMAYKPPMSITISKHESNEKECYLKDFEGRKYRTILPNSSTSTCLGFTSGYFILLKRETRELWLVNPITRSELHFPSFPSFAIDDTIKAILVFSPSKSAWLLINIPKFLFSRGIWFSKEGKGAWKHVPFPLPILDLHAFKRKIYILNPNCHVHEFKLNPSPEWTSLEIENFKKQDIVNPEFVSSGENLYVVGHMHKEPNSISELDFGEMNWVSPEEKTIREYAFFFSANNHGIAIHGIAIKPKSWAVDIQSQYKRYEFFHDTNEKWRKSGCFSAKWWYFPHRCFNADVIDEL